ncbi:MAG: phosphate signaling complex protein PhoU [Planctomycetota bacterium]|nr:phosphate signaling complex protein PhoU [Planctomycetota bacterium]
MSIHLNRELDTLHQHIMQMCAAVEQLVHKAVEDLSRPDVAVSEQLVAADDEIDRWDVRIEEECLKILALHQPVAENLRRVTAVMKIAWELERVADVAVNIAERAAGLAEGPEIAIPEKLTHMSMVAVDMLRLSLDAFVQKDSRLARDVCRQDDLVDSLNREIIDELLVMMKRSPELVDPAVQLFSASRHIERVADHATNIAEDVVYLVEGEIIRHRAEFWKR